MKEPESIGGSAFEHFARPLGARVRVIRSEPLAPVVEVSIRGEVVRERAHIIWRDQGDIGLEYLNPNLSKDALVDLLMKMEGS